jgi:putative SOS response-associated peptidase YedK
MCGRYALFGPVKRSRTMLEPSGGAGWLEELWDVVDARPPRYNLAPGQMAPVVRSTDADVVVRELRWGLLPSWAREPSIAQRAFNARRETASEKPMFRAAFRQRRCLVPASGYFEWQRVGEGKQPHFIHAADGTLLMLAGLWEHWDPPGGSRVETFTILTEDASTPTLARIHPRMPVILDASLWHDWMCAPPGLASALLAGKSDVKLACHPVSRDVGSPRHDDPHLIAAVR